MPRLCLSFFHGHASKCMALRGYISILTSSTAVRVQIQQSMDLSKRNAGFISWILVFFPMAHMYPYVLHLILDPLFVDLRFGVPGVGDNVWRAAI